MEEFDKNRKKFEEMSKEVHLGFLSLNRKISRVTCPCCGFPTLEERGHYDICSLCNWEDDGQDDETSSSIQGGPNSGYSLDQARENFIKYGIMYSPENNTTITGGDSKEREALKKELVCIFRKMLTEDKSKLIGLWKKAIKVEKSLYQELKRSIKMYEQSIKP